MWKWLLDNKDGIGIVADIATLLAIFLNIGALIYAAKQFAAGRTGASGAALVSLTESFRQAWLQFAQFDNDDAMKRHAFGDVTNLLEMACAIYHDRLFVGHSEKLLEDYLCAVFSQINRSSKARVEMHNLMEDPKNFEHIVRFINTHPNRVAQFSQSNAA